VAQPGYATCKRSRRAAPAGEDALPGERQSPSPVQVKHGLGWPGSAEQSLAGPSGLHVAVRERALRGPHVAVRGRALRVPHGAVRGRALRGPHVAVRRWVLRGPHMAVRRTASR